jgi:hypothetical protein
MPVLEMLSCQAAAVVSYADAPEGVAWRVRQRCAVPYICATATRWGRTDNTAAIGKPPQGEFFAGYGKRGSDATPTIAALASILR